MKKMASALLSLAILLLAVPMVPAHATSDYTKVINVHGGKTYMGDYSDWNDSTWNSDNFTDVTGDDIDCSEELIIKGGKVGNVTVSGDVSLTIYDGSMSDVECDGNITMSGGSASSLTSNNNDISLSGGTVKGDVKADYGNVNISGKVTVGGNLSANNITSYASSSGYTTVSGDVSFSDTMLLEGSNYKFGKVDGQSSGTLEFRNFSGSLPNLSNVENLYVYSGSTVRTSNSINVDTLTLEDRAVFASTSTLEIGTVKGPGALIFNAGQLTVDTGVSGYPVFDFNGTATSGTKAFQAKSGTVSAGDVVVYGYGLSQSASGDYDTFALQPLSGNGVTLSTASLNLGGGQSAVVQANVSPSLSQMSDGTKLSWVLFDPSGQFSITPDTSNNSCRVYLSSASGSGKATLGACLVDSGGDILSAYKSGLCVLNASGFSTNTSSYGITLDTSSVNISVGGTYSVLAVTNAPAPPAQTSYNSSVAVVGKASYYSSNGKTGWLYPVTAVGKGGVTIDIGGQKMIVSVTSGSITVDTSSYTMAPGKTYVIGVKLSGVDKSSLNVHSANSCTTVQDKGRAANGVELYSIRANQEGTGFVIFDTAAGGSVKTQINVIKGAASHGVSAKLTAVA